MTLAALLPSAADAVQLGALLPAEVRWDPVPQLPEWGRWSGQSDADPIERFLGLAQGVIVVLGVIGILYSAAKMAVGKLGRSEIAADGVGGVVWTIMGVSLMLVAISVVTTLAGV
ncbi:MULTISPECIES: hypothetical protein [Nocardiopsis]|jgi:hypothetical protein|uniref:hypothetical protein n=1 Tax=Nocardiopsis TaxID=2013 RepID=UPI00035E48AB|nr:MULTISPECIES: hypothetical protein [Nocardiopsis]ASU56357.1 hypothetical protein CGQ36_01815 [Nocardiopsis dassonvillei]